MCRAEILGDKLRNIAVEMYLRILWYQTHWTTFSFHRYDNIERVKIGIKYYQLAYECEILRLLSPPFCHPIQQNKSLAERRRWEITHTTSFSSTFYDIDTLRYNPWQSVVDTTRGWTKTLGPNSIPQEYPAQDKWLQIPVSSHCTITRCIEELLKYHNC